ncbi:hypothetical protein BC351_36800 [Paenibacillus ferrarius]|uniref:GrpB family protein n=2 Tax=Paenibacillus ferrarius TaxID=1469647 RepID=A0A1V4HCF6_9BACL|nr:hypothetical protein BC351_36800 [Paenibacillus ferrarius]
MYDPNWVELREYTPSWVEEFNKEKMVICDALGYTALNIHHVGSTSIPCLASKPIIDIIVGIQDINKFKVEDINKLESVDYVFRGNAGVPGRLFFRKGLPRAKFHLSVATLEGAYWNKQIIFRDYLRTHPNDAKEYQDLKVKLAHQYVNDRATYTNLKDPLIKSILEKAYLWRPPLSEK